jgi:hypothetical protein
MTLATARASLRRAHCTLGKVTAPLHPPRHHVLRVLGQSVGPRFLRVAGFAINVLLR